MNMKELSVYEFSKRDLMGCPCYPIKGNSIEQLLMQFIETGQKGYTVAINAEKIYRSRTDLLLKETINSSLLPYPDGAGAVMALKLLHSENSEKINMPVLALELANKHSLSVFIVGAKESVHNKAIGKVKTSYPRINLVGNLHGYHTEQQIIDAIVQAKPQLIMLALGSPKQEIFAKKLVPHISDGIVIGCGGALDIIAGNLKRAPEFWINNNLEWLYRLLQEPWRFKRQLFLPLFILRLFSTKLFGVKNK